FVLQRPERRRQCRVIAHLRSDAGPHIQFLRQLHTTDGHFRQRVAVQQQRHWSSCNAERQHPDHYQSVWNDAGCQSHRLQPDHSRGAVTKTFEQAFVTLSATAFNILYDHNDNVLPPFQTSHDGASFWFSGRVGYNFPEFYVFAQGDYILQRFDNSLFNTNGYRVIGGVGRNDPSGLFRGEVYGGYQFQHQEQQFVPFGVPVVPVLGPQDTSTGVFGGRLSYYPTPYWTIIAQVDEILGMATTLSATTPFGIPTRTITAILQTTYGLSRS